ncbi:kinesin-like protein KIF20B [Ochotona curzoniae]|uniref:kinesin-like protein KIF20B n=1 Tax=Ochotona curzoniae TaxID=130825 RepID=UPI001B34E1B5|nr:kinesin-like protein KIF20B [Ochotona curzoniae]
MIADVQKVYVPDALNSSRERAGGTSKSSEDISVDNNSDNKMLNVKRATVSWENNLEDLVEDEDLAEDLEEGEETQNKEMELSDEDLDRTVEDKTLLNCKENKKLLNLIEELKKKLINEKKEKLTLELKIREEVTQEFTQYLAEREADFKEAILQEREMSEENAECRLAIFKELVGVCDIQEEPSNRVCAVKVETEVYVPDALNSSRERAGGTSKSSEDISVDNNSDNKMLNVKRATVSWENNLEDLVEDEELAEDLEEGEETQNKEMELSDEDLDRTVEDKTLLNCKENKKLLNLIEELKKKLINEKKEKLTLELKIREEVTQEFTQYLAEREADFKEAILQEREMSEENAECRLAIFKELVGVCDIQEEPSNRVCAVKVETEVYVPDALNSSRERAGGTSKSSEDISVDNNSDNKMLNVKRATVSWENNLEDLVEDEELAEDLEEGEETQNKEMELSDEDLDRNVEDKTLLNCKENKKLLNLIEELKKN